MLSFASPFFISVIKKNQHNCNYDRCCEDYANGLQGFRYGFDLFGRFRLSGAFADGHNFGDDLGNSRAVVISAYDRYGGLYLRIIGDGCGLFCLSGDFYVLVGLGL